MQGSFPRVLLVSTCIAALCAACGSGRAAESEALIPREVGNLNGTAWTLALTDDTTNVPTTARVTLSFEGATASGMAPCNRYHFPFAHDGSKVTAGPIASTQIACSPHVMDAEQRYFRALEAIDHADMEMQRLVLTGHGGVRLVYTRAEHPAGAS